MQDVAAVGADKAKATGAAVQESARCVQVDSHKCKHCPGDCMVHDCVMDTAAA